MNSAERWIGSILAGVALVAFFFPQTYSTIPIAGTTSATGYEIINFSGEDTALERALDTVKDKSRDSAGDDRPDFDEIELPWSLRTAFLLKGWIGVLFLGAAAAVVSALVGSRNAFVWASGLAMIAGVLGVVHLRMMNSDLHEFVSAQLEGAPGDLDGNPFAELAKGIGQMLMGSVELGPAQGLYFATGMMMVLFLAIGTGLLSRVRIDLAPAGEASSSDSGPNDRQTPQ